MNGSYLGPEYSQEKIENDLSTIGAVYEVMEEDKIIEKTVNDLEIYVIHWPVVVSSLYDILCKW